ncbi:MAG: hypothetical protein SVK08_01395 [Halobacteriota archaeon]|nr:hypothetical protein [Halobacteriota archaeon]
MNAKSTALGMLKSKSIGLFLVLQVIMLMAQPYLVKYGVDPAVTNAIVDIVAVALLRLITKSSLAEKGSGFEKFKEVLDKSDQFLSNPFYRSLLAPIFEKNGIKIPEPVDQKKYKIAGKLYYKLPDGSFIPV